MLRPVIVAVVVVVLIVVVQVVGSKFGVVEYATTYESAVILFHVISAEFEVMFVAIMFVEGRQVGAVTDTSSIEK